MQWLAVADYNASYSGQNVLFIFPQLILPLSSWFICMALSKVYVSKCSSDSGLNIDITTLAIFQDEQHKSQLYMKVEVTQEDFCMHKISINQSIGPIW